MTNSNQLSFLNRIIKNMKLGVAIAFFIISFISLVNSAILAALLFLLSGLIVLPQLSEFRKKYVPFLNNKFYKFGILSMLVLVGIIILAANSSSEKDIETKLKKLDIRLSEFKIKDSTNIVLKNVFTLKQYGNLFGQTNSIFWTINKDNTKFEDENIVLISPFKGDTIATDKFIKDYPIEDYVLKIKVDTSYQILAISALVKIKGKDYEWNKKNCPDLDKFIISDAITEQKRTIQSQNNSLSIQKAESNKKEQQTKFNDECFSVYEGECHNLVRLVKKNLRDPDSYEHIETKAWTLKDYAVVSMKYRGNNALGGKSIGYVKAKISFDCEVLEIIEEGQI